MNIHMSSEKMKEQEYRFEELKTMISTNLHRNSRNKTIFIYRENSAFFLITSLRVARTAAIVSSDVIWSCVRLPDGSFWTKSLMAYFPEMRNGV